MISDDQVVTEVFYSIVPNLKILTSHNYDADFAVTNDQVANTQDSFRNHPSIVMIKNKRSAFTLV